MGLSERYLLGIDIGTQSVKVCVFDTAGGIVARRSLDQYMQNARPGWATERPEHWYELIRRGIGEILAEDGVRAEEIAGVGVDTVMHCPVALTRDGRLTEQDVQMYCDKRTADLVMGLRGRPELMERVHALTGNYPGTQWMGMKIAWIKEHTPKAYEETYKFVCGKDYINYRLTGEFAIDPSEASGTCLLRREADEWSQDLLGLDREKLPRILPSDAVVGTVHRRAAEETGLREGTPVVCGGGDMLAGLLGAGLTRPGIVVDLTGTGSVIAYYDREPCPDPHIANVRHVIDGWTPYNSLDSSGGALRWFRDCCCKKEVELAKAAGKRAFEYLEQEAERTPKGADGVLFFPYLQGERNLGSPYSRGMFLGMTPATTTAHLTRAVMEGVAFEHYRTIELFKTGAAPVAKLIHTGGAAKSPVWSKIKADVYGLPVEMSVTEESTAWGSAALAAVGAGLCGDAAELVERAYRQGPVVEPDWGDHARYQELFAIYKEIHDLMQGPFEALAKRV